MTLVTVCSFNFLPESAEDMGLCRVCSDSFLLEGLEKYLKYGFLLTLWLNLEALSGTYHAPSIQSDIPLCTANAHTLKHGSNLQNYLPLPVAIWILNPKPNQRSTTQIWLLFSGKKSHYDKEIFSGNK